MRPHGRHRSTASLGLRETEPWQAWWAPVVVGLVLRLLVVLAMPLPPSSDALWYFERAQEMLATGRYAEEGVSTAFWPVGYPAFLALVSAPVGNEVWPGQWANALLAVALMALLYRWCMQLWGDWRVASTAAWLLALYPNHIAYTGQLLTEPLYAVLVLALVVLAQSQQLPARWFFVGLLAGLASLVKAQTVLFAPLLVGLLVFVQGTGRSAPNQTMAYAVRAWLLAMLAMAATVLPWTLRNANVMGAPVPVSTNGGISLLIGNNDDMYWGQVRSYVQDAALVKEARFSVADQVQADQRARALALGWMAQHPGQFLGLMPLKACRQWCLDGEAEWAYQSTYADYAQQAWAFRTVRVLNQIYYFALLALCVGALVPYWLRKLKAWRSARGAAGRQPASQQGGPAKAARWSRADLRHAVLPLMFIYFTALAMVFFGLPRYRFHLMPLVIGYAAALLVHRAQRRKRRPPVRRWS
jgi:Dolichyl-phosphate-mannose-protein mannosyltransferase